MSLNSVKPGVNVPYDVNVIIEIPSHSDPVKYEVDKETGALMVDRFMSTAMHYPCNYGYIPHTLAEDGDPVDMLVLCPFSLISGSIVRCRPIGVLVMEDDGGIDHKILAVPINKLSQLSQEIETLNDVPAHYRNQIQHFFQHYKDLEPGKWVKIEGWKDAETAHETIMSSIERYKQKA